MTKKKVKKKPSEIEWGGIGDPEYLESVTGGKVFKGKVATDEEVCEFFGMDEGKRIYDEFFAQEPNFGDNALIVHHKNTFKKCVDISRAKCADYAGDFDPLANFRMCQQFGVSLEHGIMVRLSDKISRIGRLLNKENAVADEKIEDSIEDAIVYLSILLFALKEKND